MSGKRALHASDTQTEKHINQSAIHAHGGADVFLPRNMFTMSSDGAGDAGKGILLDASGLIDVDLLPSVGAEDFLDLTDTPSSYSGEGGKYVRVNATPDALEFVVPTLLELSDFPASYAGEGGKFLRVNATPDGIEFVAESVIDHDNLLNTHNLSTDIDHDGLTNTHNLSTDIDHDGLTNTHNLTTDIDHGSISGLDDNDHGAIYYTESEIQAVLDMTNKVTKTAVGARAYLTSNMLNITDSTNVIAQLGTENYDIGSDFNTGTYAFVTAVAGYYLLAGCIHFYNTEGNDEYYTRIFNNTTMLCQSSSIMPSSGAPVWVSVADVQYIAASQNIYLKIYMEGTGGGVDVAAGTDDTWMAVTLLHV